MRTVRAIRIDTAFHKELDEAENKAAYSADKLMEEIDDMSGIVRKLREGIREMGATATEEGGVHVDEDYLGLANDLTRKFLPLVESGMKGLEDAKKWFDRNWS